MRGAFSLRNVNSVSERSSTWRSTPRIDWFRDPRLVDDPYPYSNASRGKCPVEPEDHYGVTMFTGWEEAVAAQETGERTGH
jgi:hypothetical protein